VTWLLVAASAAHVGMLAYGVLLVMRVLVSNGRPELFVLYQLVIAFCGLALTGPGMATVSRAIIERRHRLALIDMNRRLEREVRERVAESLAIRNALIFGLAKLADYRDTDTGTHLERIGEYAVILAGALRRTHPEIDDQWIERLKLASSLHDIGKVGIPDSVLLKPGRLSDRERLVMEQHPLIGADTLLAIRSQLGHNAFLDMGIEVTLQHHERWDGSGYPFGLSGGMIAMSARLVALADYYDAVTSERIYKSAMAHDEAVELIRAGRGTHFDPAVADAFLAVADRFDAVRRAMQTTAPRPAPDTGLTAPYLGITRPAA